MRKKIYGILHISNYWITGMIIERKKHETIILSSQKWEICQSTDKLEDQLAESTKKVLLSFLTTLSNKKVKIILTFSHSDILTREIELPKTSKKERDHMLQIHLKSVLPTTIHQYLIHSTKIPNIDFNLKLTDKWLIIALPYTMVKPYILFVEDQGFRIEKIDYMGYDFQQTLFENIDISKCSTSYIAFIEKRVGEMNIYLYYKQLLCFSRHYAYEDKNEESCLNHLKYFLEFFYHRISNTPLSLIFISDEKNKEKHSLFQLLESKEYPIDSYQQYDYHLLFNNSLIKVDKPNVLWTFLSTNSKKIVEDSFFFSKRKKKLCLFLIFFMLLTGSAAIGHYYLFQYEKYMVSVIKDFHIEQQDYDYFLLLKNILHKQQTAIHYVDIQHSPNIALFESISWIIKQNDVQINTLNYSNHIWEIEGEALEYDSILQFFQHLEEVVVNQNFFLQSIWKDESKESYKNRYKFRFIIFEKEDL